MLLTPDQLHEISQIIADRHAAFIVNTIGPEAVAPQVLERLKELGLVDVKIESVRDAYLYGQVVAAAQAPGVQNMSYQDFKAWVKKNPVPLSPIENDAIAYAQQRAGIYCRGLGNRVNVQTGSVAIEADAQLRQQMRQKIMTATEEGIAKRKTLKQIKSDLGWATKDWTRDWERIANTEQQFAMQQGQRDYIADEWGPDAEVAVLVMPDRCQECEKHYTDGGMPKIFRLDELEANGTNVGIKRPNWQPVIPPMHPHCQCQLQRVPPGYGFRLVRGKPADDPRSYQMVPGGERKFSQTGAAEPLKKADKNARHFINFQGIRIAIENPAGSVRHWEAEGERGVTTMLVPYGYVVDTIGADTDGIDVFVGPIKDAPMAYVVHQQNPKTGTYDEDKVMLGFRNEHEALVTYQLHFDRPDFAAMVSPMPIDAFKRWIWAQGPKPYGLEKAIPEVPLVIRLEKGNVRSAGVVRGSEAMASGMADTMPMGREISGGGNGFNYAFDARQTYRPPPVDMTPTGSPFNPGKIPYSDAAVKRDPKDYEYQEPAKVRPVKLVIPADYGGVVIGTGEPERNRNKVERQWQQDRAVSKNTVEVEDSDREKATKKKGGKRPVKRKPKAKEEEDNDENPTLH